jgi:hypothetical protein
MAEAYGPAGEGIGRRASRTTPARHAFANGRGIRALGRVDLDRQRTCIFERALIAFRDVDAGCSGPVGAEATQRRDRKLGTTGSSIERAAGTG